VTLLLLVHVICHSYIATAVLLVLVYVIFLTHVFIRTFINFSSSLCAGLSRLFTLQFLRAHWTCLVFSYHVKNLVYITAVSVHQKLGWWVAFPVVSVMLLEWDYPDLNQQIYRRALDLVWCCIEYQCMALCWQSISPMQCMGICQLQLQLQLQWGYLVPRIYETRPGGITIVIECV